MSNIDYLKEIAREIRIDTLKSIHIAKSGHPGGSLSAVEILTVLYFYKMKIDPKNPNYNDRDRFILSKGHAGPALFAILAKKGFFDKEELWKLRRIDSLLQGGPNLSVPGIDMSSGSLGQGISVGVGMALAGKMKNKGYKVYVVLGDGEIQEGQVWEAAMSAAHFKLGNLVAILDQNHVQMCGTTEEIMNVGDVGAKFVSFGWNVVRINGHDIEQLIKSLDSVPNDNSGVPTLIIADTVKGKGVSYMEGKSLWHGAVIDENQLAEALSQLGRVEE